VHSFRDILSQKSLGVNLAPAVYFKIQCVLKIDLTFDTNKS